MGNITLGREEILKITACLNEIAAILDIPGGKTKEPEPAPEPEPEPEDPPAPEVDPEWLETYKKAGELVQLGWDKLGIASVARILFNDVRWQDNRDTDRTDRKAPSASALRGTANGTMGSNGKPQYRPVFLDQIIDILTDVLLAKETKHVRFSDDSTGDTGAEAASEPAAPEGHS